MVLAASSRTARKGTPLNELGLPLMVRALPLTVALMVCAVQGIASPATSVQANMRVVVRANVRARVR
jgi:hypothetical protein